MRVARLASAPAIILLAIALSSACLAAPVPSAVHVPGTWNSSWAKLSSGPWSKREGLMAVSVNGTMFMSGGRQTDGLGFAQDVWRSTDGVSWTAAASPAAFGARAYHNMVELNGCMYIMGGQTFTTYYNDVWRSCDAAGADWHLLTKNASWPPRAGAAAVTTKQGEIILAGGCYADKGARKFRGDVWASKDGITWELRAAQAQWSARSGPRLVQFMSDLWIVAGERGFTAKVQLGDVWRSPDAGATWALATASPGFSARSGHGVFVDGPQMVMVAGWPELHDLWTTGDGVHWTLQTDDVWGCGATSCGKFDFWSLLHEGSLFTLGGSGASSTFGKLYAETWKLN